MRPDGGAKGDEHARSAGIRSRLRSVLTSRRAVLFSAIVAVLLVGLLAGSTGEGPLSRWRGALDGSDGAAGREDGASSTLTDSAERDIIGIGGGPSEGDDLSVSGGSGSSGGDGASGGSGSSGGDGASGGGGSSSGDGASGGTTGEGSDTGTAGSNDGGSAADDPTKPPATAPQPPAVSRSVAYLDEVFGEAMYPDEYPGLRQVSVFDYDDDEVTATYKDLGSAHFDLVRITVERTGSDAEAARALEQLRKLFPADTVSYDWGGRAVVQSSDVSIGAGQDPVFNFSWTQGRYAIDVTVYPPYRSGVTEGRAAALEFIGRLEY